MGKSSRIALFLRSVVSDLPYYPNVLPSAHMEGVARMQKADCPGSRPSSTWRDSP